MVFSLVEETNMKTPEWLKPALYGAAAGAAVLAINGFSWGGWVTGSKAQEMAADAAVAALVPICIEQSNRDPQLAIIGGRWRDSALGAMPGFPVIGQARGSGLVA